MFASCFGHAGIAMALIGQGVNVNALNNDGDCALMLATSNGHVEIARWLLDHGARQHDRNASVNIDDSELLRHANASGVNLAED